MAKYDPNTKYGWENSTPFVFNGHEFGLVLNTLRNILATPESQKVLQMIQASNTMEAILAKNVESGAIEPVKDSDEAPQALMNVVPEDKNPKKRTTKSIHRPKK